MDASERLKSILLEIRLNPNQLGKEIGKDGDTLRSILNKRTRNFSAEIASLIADKYGIDYVWIMTGKGEMRNIKTCLECIQKDKKIEKLESDLKRITKDFNECLRELSGRKLHSG